MIDIIAALDNIADVLEQKGLSDKALYIDKLADAFDYYVDETEFSLREAKKRKKKWIPKDLEEGALHRYFGVPEDEKIPVEKIDKKYKELQEKSKDKKLNAEDSKLFKRLHFAVVMRGRGKKKD